MSEMDVLKIDHFRTFRTKKCPKIKKCPKRFGAAGAIRIGPDRMTGRRRRHPPAAGGRMRTGRKGQMQNLKKQRDLGTIHWLPLQLKLVLVYRYYRQVVLLRTLSNIIWWFLTRTGYHCAKCITIFCTPTITSGWKIRAEDAIFFDQFSDIFGYFFGHFQISFSDILKRLRTFFSDILKSLKKGMFSGWC